MYKNKVKFTNAQAAEMNPRRVQSFIITTCMTCMYVQLSVRIYRLHKIKLLPVNVYFYRQNDL